MNAHCRALSGLVTLETVTQGVSLGFVVSAFQAFGPSVYNRALTQVDEAALDGQGGCLGAVGGA